MCGGPHRSALREETGDGHASVHGDGLMSIGAVRERRFEHGTPSCERAESLVTVAPAAGERGGEAVDEVQRWRTEGNEVVQRVGQLVLHQAAPPRQHQVAGGGTA